jgi:hypothetical protein
MWATRKSAAAGKTLFAKRSLMTSSGEDALALVGKGGGFGAFGELIVCWAN